MAPNPFTVLPSQPEAPTVVDGRLRCSSQNLMLVPNYMQFVSRILLLFIDVATWSFFTNHARILICIARDPGLRLRDLATAVDITERSAHAIVTDLVEAGYVVKEKDGRRNQYRIETQLPLRESISAERTIGEVLALLVGAEAVKRRTPQR
jgi:DNA-binding transcriptional ArsR family regulator